MDVPKLAARPVSGDDTKALVYSATSEAHVYVAMPEGGGEGGPIAAEDITDASEVGQAVLTAEDAEAARAAIGAAAEGEGGSAEISTDSGNQIVLGTDDGIFVAAPDLSGYATTTALTEGLGAKADTSSLHEVATSGSWDDLDDKPSIPSAPGDVGAAAASHGHTASQITDSGSTGRSLVQAANAAAARTTLSLGDAATLNVGTSAGTVKAGDYAPAAATTSASGIVELSTNAEAIAGTDTVRAITPAALAAALATIEGVTPSLIMVWFDGEDWIDPDGEVITVRPTAKRVLALGGETQPSWLIAGDAWYEAETVAPEPPDTTIFTEDFNGGSDGGAISTGNSTASVIVGTPTYIASSIEGTLAGRYNASAAQVSSGHPHDTIDGVAWLSMYIYVPALPAENTYFTSWYTTHNGTKIGDIRLQPDGSVVARNNATAVITSPALVTAASWHRIEWRVTRNTGMELRLFIGANRHGSTPDWSGTGASTQDVTPGHLYLGMTSSSTADIRYDRVRISHTNPAPPMEA